MNRFRWIFILFIILNPKLVIAESPDNSAQQSLWEYGIGLGYVHFAQYPAADQFTDLVLPFPTFQYRGKILRADDREGTRIYILKSAVWSIELSGGGNTPLKASDSKARDGMEDIPLMIHLGPQIVGHLLENLEIKFGFFQALSTDFMELRTSGGIQETQLVYRVLSDLDSGRIDGRFSLAARTASKDYLETYFTVAPQFINKDREQYTAKPGFLEFEFSYFQSISFGKASYYVGASIDDYSLSANRKSPLHKSDYNLNYIFGMTYTLGQSMRESVPPKKTEGIIRIK